MLQLSTIFKYITVNALLIPLNLTSAWVLTALGIHYLIATTIGFVIHISLAFFLNRYWTFHATQVRTWSGLARASLVELSAIGVVLITTVIAVEILAWSFLNARIGAIAVSGVYCYLLDSLFTFRIKQHKKTT